MIAVRRWSSLAGRWDLALAVIAAGLWASTNRVADVTWREVAFVVAQVTVLHLGWLTRSSGWQDWPPTPPFSQPRCRVSAYERGLLLNLTGRAVANILPLGGAVATGLN